MQEIGSNIQLRLPSFDETFLALTGNRPFPWQRELYDRFVSDRPDSIPASCNLPTGLGKTSVVAIWLIALANRPDRIPRRLVYVVNRRTVVDQTTEEKLRRNISAAGMCEPLQALCATKHDIPLAISTLRGQFADNREWSADPSRPAVICGTVDMIGSRLLFSGYRVGFKAKPLHAGFLGQDALLVHDEAHLEPAFQELIETIQYEQDCREQTGKLPWPKLRVMELTATSRADGHSFPNPDEWKENESHPIVRDRLAAKKGIALYPRRRSDLAKAIGKQALTYKDSGKAILVFVRGVDDVSAVRNVLCHKTDGVESSQVQSLTGTMRGLERDRMVDMQDSERGSMVFARFLENARPSARTEQHWKVARENRAVYLICTSAGEVGVDISADHLVCDLTPLDSMMQRLGRVNRRGGGEALVDVFVESDPDPKKKDDSLEKARWKTKEIIESLPKCDWGDGDCREGAPLQFRNLNLSNDDRKTAFAPKPTILPATDILFDAWAMTSIRDRMPGRPPVEPYEARSAIRR